MQVYTIRSSVDPLLIMQVMRHDVALALGKSGPNVDVMCTDKEFGGRFMPFAKVRQTSSAMLHMQPSLPAVKIPCNRMQPVLHQTGDWWN